jgi:kynureninase
VGWFSHADPFEFDIHHFAYAPDALRFWGGTPSVAPALVASHAMERLLELGLARIEAHNRELGEWLIEAIDPRFLVSPTDPGSRGGSVILHFGTQQEAVAGRLRNAGVQFDLRAEGMRLSPHFYNSGEDVKRVLACAP